MNLTFIPPLVSSLLFILFAFFVLSKNKESKLNQNFALLCLTTFFWQFSWVFLFGFNFSESHRSILIKVGYSGILFLPVVYFRFIVKFVGSKVDQKWLNFSYIFCALMLIALWKSKLFIDGYSMHTWGVYPKAGLLHPFYLLVLTLLSARGLILLNTEKNRETNNQRKNQIQYLMWGLIVYLPASTDFLVNYQFSFYPFGFLFITSFLAITAVGIAKHQLLDIEVVIRRTAVFAGLFAFVYGVFSVATILGQELFTKYLGWNQWLSTIPTVLIITFALRPLENYLTNITERFLFQKKFDYRELLRTFTNEVLTVLELQKLTEQTISGLTRIIKLETAAILLHDRDAKSYKIAAASGVKRDLIFKEDDTLISYLKHSHLPMLKDKEADKMDGHSNLREDYKKLNAQLCLPIMHHDELIGVLSLGMKKSGEEFSYEDIDILATLARTLGIAIANAQLFDQLSKTQAEAAQREKMAVIGTLAAGINHEICNPLGIVRGQCEMFLLNLRDGIYNSKSKDEILQISTDIMNKVIKETDRATGITKRLSGFAKPAKKADSEEINVEKEADEVLALLAHDLKLNNIAFAKNFSPDFPSIFADRRQIQEVLFNIIRNAAQAMDKKSGQINLSGITENGSAIIKIADNGSGIPQDKIGQIFNPFFTTKEPGKGTGLGLFIVRQVIERNKGTITVESQEGMGTTFTLTFPAAKTAVAA